MQIEKLDHVNLRTTELEAMIAWYRDILGLRLGDRPDFQSPGAWMYAGDSACVHLVGIEQPAGAGSEAALKLEHFAFSAHGRVQFEQSLQQAGERFERVEITSFNIVQINLWDYDGNHIHVDFPADESRQEPGS